MQRPVSIALVVLLSLAGGLALLFGGDREAPAGDDQRSLPTTSIHGLVTPSTAAYFADPRVRKEFAAHGLRVEIAAMSSTRMARSTAADFATYDFVFPSNLPLAEKIQQATGAGTSFSPFYSPLVVATSSNVAFALGKAGVAKRVDGYWLLDFAAYLDLVSAGTRGEDLAGRSQEGPPGQASPPSFAALTQAPVTTGDPRTSDVAALYIALASYVANDAAVVTSRSELRRVRPKVARLFPGRPTSTPVPEAPSARPPNAEAVPIGTELNLGPGRPMVAILESDFVGRYVKRQQAADQLRPSPSPSGVPTPTARPTPSPSSNPIAGDTVLLYPRPTTIAKHTLVPLTTRGDMAGKLLVNDPELGSLAAGLGFRTANRAAFAGVVEDLRVPAPEDMARVAGTPSYELLQNLISAVTTPEMSRNVPE
jgi:hypothetical protein